MAAPHVTGSDPSRTRRSRKFNGPPRYTADHELPDYRYGEEGTGESDVGSSRQIPNYFPASGIDDAVAANTEADGQHAHPEMDPLLAEESDPIDGHIEELQKRLGPQGKGLYRKQAPKGQFGLELQAPHGLWLLKDFFRVLAGVEISERELMRMLMSNDVLPLVKGWKREIFDDVEDTSIYGRGCLSLAFDMHLVWAEEESEKYLAGERIRVAHMARTSGVHRKTHPNWNDMATFEKKALEKTAVWVAKLHKCCSLLRKVELRKEIHGFFLCVLILVTAWTDLRAEPEEGFFAILLDSPLSQPMVARIRQKWERKCHLPVVKESRDAWTSDGATEELIELVDIDTDEFSEEETLAMLLAYKDAKKGTERRSMQPGDDVVDIPWDEVSDVLPGRTSDECEMVFNSLMEYGTVEIKPGKGKRELSSPDILPAKKARKATVSEVGGSAGLGDMKKTVGPESSSPGLFLSPESSPEIPLAKMARKAAVPDFSVWGTDETHTRAATSEPPESFAEIWSSGRGSPPDGPDDSILAVGLHQEAAVTAGRATMAEGFGGDVELESKHTSTDLPPDVQPAAPTQRPSSVGGFAGTAAVLKYAALDRVRQARQQATDLNEKLVEVSQAGMQARNELTQAHGKISGLEARVRELEETVSGQQKVIAQDDESKVRLESALSRIAELERAAEHHEEEMEQLRATNRHLEADIHSAEGVVKEKTRTIKEQVNQIRDLQADGKAATLQVIQLEEIAKRREPYVPPQLS